MNATEHFSASNEGGSPLVPWERVERFVGQVSHDLRNGLNACELQLTFLAEISTEADAVEEVKGLRTSLAGITKQLQAIRVATGSVKAHRLDYPAADLFEDLRDRFAKLHPEAAGKIEWQVEIGGETLVSVDPDITINAGMELLNNALHFADGGGTVRCTMREEGGQVLCTVSEPLAAAPADAPADWGRSPLQSTRRGGYGLGLFRARRALEAQGSQLDFQHLSGQEKLVATVTLPGAGRTTT